MIPVVTTHGLYAGAKACIVGLGIIFGLTAFANCNEGCKPAQDVTEAERNYTTEIIACAATAGYPGAYDHAADMRCRAGVDCRYGLGPCS